MQPILTTYAQHMGPNSPWIQPLAKYHDFFVQKIEQSPSELQKLAWRVAQVLTGVILYPILGAIAAIGFLVHRCSQDSAPAVATQKPSVSSEFITSCIQEVQKEVAKALRAIHSIERGSYSQGHSHLTNPGDTFNKKQSFTIEFTQEEAFSDTSCSSPNLQFLAFLDRLETLCTEHQWAVENYRVNASKANTLKKVTLTLPIPDRLDASELEQRLKKLTVKESRIEHMKRLCLLASKYSEDHVSRISGPPILDSERGLYSEGKTLALSIPKHDILSPEGHLHTKLQRFFSILENNEVGCSLTWEMPGYWVTTFSAGVIITLPIPDSSAELPTLDT